MPTQKPAAPATLTLLAHVVNSFGGIAAVPDFTLTATRSPVVAPEAAAGNMAAMFSAPTMFSTPTSSLTWLSGVTGDPAVTNAALVAGVYSLSETAPPSGYTVSSWACDGGRLNGSDVAVTLGETVVCTIIFTDSPAHLTLIKEVVNGHGGTAVATDWTLSAVGPVTITGTSGLPAVTAAAVPAGDFMLSESAGPTGYTASAWVCVGGTLNGGALTLAFAQSATCTVTNTQDAPRASPMPIVPPASPMPIVSPVAPPVAPPADPAAPILAYTGAGIVPMGLFGLIALALGAVLTVAGRRRARD